jgi:hypothetical protein
VGLLAQGAVDAIAVDDDAADDDDVGIMRMRVLS